MSNPYLPGGWYKVEDDPKIAPMRVFESGATRSTDASKPDYEGFLSPLALVAYGEYMSKHQIQADGKPRASDNWQRGIPRDALIKSAFRHFVQWWLEHRGHATPDGMEAALCGLLFNVQAYLHEVRKGRDPTAPVYHWEAR